MQHQTHTDSLQAEDVPDDSRPATAHGLRLLWIGPDEPSWIGLALRLDAEGCRESRFRWASTSNEALSILRDEAFDCILIGDRSSLRTSSPAGNSELLVQAVRSSGCDDPVILVTPLTNDERCVRLWALNCETLVTASSYDSPALLPMIRRALSHTERIRENHRLSIVQQRRVSRERDEAEHLLQQQREMIGKLDYPFPAAADDTDNSHGAIGDVPRPAAAPAPPAALPDETKEFYHELLRTYVIMGSGSLESEIAGFARLLAAAGIRPRQALQFHLERVESLVRDLGNRSARHVMARADLLALELMVYLAEEYRRAGGTNSGPTANRQVSRHPAENP